MCLYVYGCMHVALELDSRVVGTELVSSETAVHTFSC